MDKEQKIVTACQIDLRGYEAEVILRARGFQDVYSLEGGMSGWPYATESDNDKSKHFNIVMQGGEKHE